MRRRYVLALVLATAPIFAVAGYFAHDLRGNGSSQSVDMAALQAKAETRIREELHGGPNPDPLDNPVLSLSLHCYSTLTFQVMDLYYFDCYWNPRLGNPEIYSEAPVTVSSN
jgi:hypothetical protein